MFVTAVWHISAFILLVCAVNAVDVPAGDAGRLDGADERGDVPQTTLVDHQLLLHCRASLCLAGEPVIGHLALFGYIRVLSL